MKNLTGGEEMNNPFNQSWMPLFQQVRILVPSTSREINVNKKGSLNWYKNLVLARV